MHVLARACAGLNGHFLIADDVHECAHGIHPLLNCSTTYLVLMGSAFKGTNGIRKGKLLLVAYATAIPASFWFPAIGRAIYVLVALLWLLPDRRIERVLGKG